MIHTNRIVTVGEQESIIDRPMVLYRGDREVEIEFTLVGNEFTFSEDGNVIKSVNASHGQLVLNTPSGEHMFSELAECHEGKVVFVVTKEMIDEFVEVGFYSFQIRLYDSAEMKSRVTIPPVLNGFDIRNPIAAEDETNVVDQGIVDYARIFKDQSNEELPTFDWTGAYNKTEWAHHDVITENKMNKIEDALYSINANIKESDVVMLNTLDKVKKDADKYVKEHMAEVEADVEEFERNLNTGVEQFKIDTNAAMTAHKNEVSEELESVNSQLVDNKNAINKLNYYVTPEDFGAIGDGVADDSHPFNQMFATKLPIKFTKNANYKINGIPAMNNMNVEGLADVVISLFKKEDATNPVLLGFGSNSVWRNIKFKCLEDDLEWNRGDIVNRNNILIENCTIEGFRDIGAPNAWGIYLEKSKNITIKNCVFNNNSQSDIAIVNNCSFITIANCTGEALHINIEPNNGDPISHINIQNCDIARLNLLENSAVSETIDAVITDCNIKQLQYKGGKVSFRGCRIDKIKSINLLYLSEIDRGNSIPLGGNLISDPKFIDLSVGSSNKDTMWTTGYVANANTLNRGVNGLETYLSINPKHTNTQVNLLSRKINVKSGGTYALEITSNAEYTDTARFVSVFGQLIIYDENNNSLYTSNIIMNQSDINTITSVKTRTCFINIPEDGASVVIRLCNTSTTTTSTTCLNLYNIAFREVISGTGDIDISLNNETFINVLPETIYACGTEFISHIKGERVYMKEPVAGGYLGYVCVESGNPGVWKGFGPIEA